jgi:hypothetical protein
MTCTLTLARRTRYSGQILPLYPCASRTLMYPVTATNTFNIDTITIHVWLNPSLFGQTRDG